MCPYTNEINVLFDCVGQFPGYTLPSRTACVTLDQRWTSAGTVLALAQAPESRLETNSRRMFLTSRRRLLDSSAAERMKLADETARSACGRVSQIFPQWQLTHHALSGSPAHEILDLARQWEPELIVVGSHGRTALGRFVLGSVSQKVLTEAQTSVRISRETIGTGGSAVRVVIGVDGSEGAKNALRMVALREWPPGSEVRVVVAVGSARNQVGVSFDTARRSIYR